METDTTRLIPKTATPQSPKTAAALFGIGLEDELPPDDDSTIMVMPPSTHRDITLGEKSGDYIGRYCLREVLGEGGFGMVWLAEQYEPIRREVALKVIKAGMDSQEIISRFDTERQALALMDHPNIAGVLDAGATATGRPFFVMELVKGPAITKYCDQKRLTVRQRLELFIPICQAVQHAHQKAILHRDLKPSNILVTEVDARPVPMVIDFGIAKALGTSDAAGFVGEIVQTMQGVIIGTPQYMSPEQAGLNNLDVDTRSDIYSLGVILFELLTGETPLPIEVARKSPIDEILRHIREEDAKRPSSRLIHLTEKVRATAELRHTHAPRLTQVLKRDLDWIVLRALEKDRDRRYDTATSLMLDIQRYLNDEPVSATPPSVAYRFMKMVRRHRKTMAAAAAIVLSLIVGLATTTYALEREKAALAREAAERLQAEQARSQAETAQQQEAIARANAEKERSIAETERAKAVTAAEAERQAKQIATAARDKAETLIEDMLIDLRGKLVPLGRSALLATVAESADKYFTDLPKESLNDVQWRQRAMIAEFRGMIDLSRGNRTAAQVQFDACLDILNRRVESAPQNPAYLRDLAVACQGVGVGHEEAGQLAPARAMFDRQLKLMNQLIGLQPRETLNQRDLAIAHAALARLDTREEQWDSAIQHLNAASGVLKDMIVKSPTNAMLQRDYAAVLEQHGSWLMHQKQPAEAQKVFEESVQLRRAILQAGQGDESYHRQLGVTLENLADSLQSQNQFSAAMPLYRERLDSALSLAKADPLNLDYQNDVISSHEKLAATAEHLQQWKEAIPLRAEIVQLKEARLVNDPADIPALTALSEAQHHLARAYLASGQMDLLPVAIKTLQTSRDRLQKLASAKTLDAAGLKLLESVKQAQDAIQKATGGR